MILFWSTLISVSLPDNKLHNGKDLAYSAHCARSICIEEPGEQITIGHNIPWGCQVLDRWSKTRAGGSNRNTSLGSYSSRETFIFTWECFAHPPRQYAESKEFLKRTEPRPYGWAWVQPGPGELRRRGNSLTWPRASRRVRLRGSSRKWLDPKRRPGARPSASPVRRWAGPWSRYSARLGSCRRPAVSSALRAAEALAMATFISVQQKKTSEVDLAKPLVKFIQQTYPSGGEEQAQYCRAAEELSKLRRAALGRPLDKHEGALETLLRWAWGRDGGGRRRPATLLASSALPASLLYTHCPGPGPSLPGRVGVVCIPSCLAGPGDPTRFPWLPTPALGLLGLGRSGRNALPRTDLSCHIYPELVFFTFSGVLNETPPFTAKLSWSGLDFIMLIAWGKWQNWDIGTHVYYLSTWNEPSS